MGNNITRISKSKESKNKSIDNISNSSSSGNDKDSLENLKKNVKSIYPLLNINKDNDRLIYQHFILKFLLKGNLHLSKNIIEDIMNKEERINILDLGCGTGVWCFDLMDEIKNINDNIYLYGTDIDKRYPEEIKPKNIVFGFMSTLDEIENIELNFINKENFDFIYQRLMFAAFKQDDWEIAIKNIIKLLKKDGWFEIVDTDSIIRYNNTKPSNNVLNMNKRWQDFLKSCNINTRLISELDKLLIKNNIKVEKKTIKVPIGTIDNKIAKQFADDWSMAMLNSKDKIKYENETDEEFKNIVENFKIELLKSNNYYTYFYIYIGQK
jgi:SAM-dependent methyltransferase